METASLNARIPKDLKVRLDVAIAQRSTSIQSAVAEALEDWLNEESPASAAAFSEFGELTRYEVEIAKAAIQMSRADAEEQQAIRWTLKKWIGKFRPVKQIKVG